MRAKKVPTVKHTFGVVVLNGDYFASYRLSVLNDSLFVNGLQCERIHDPDVDVAFGQFVRCLQGFVQSDARSNDKGAVTLVLPENLQETCHGSANLTYRHTGDTKSTC